MLCGIGECDRCRFFLPAGICILLSVCVGGGGGLYGVIGCGAAEATDLGFSCFVVINPRVLSAYRVDFGLLFFVS